MADFPPLVATYRVQLTPTFGLRQATTIVPYLARLGISHVYTSSYLQAAAGSTHGYDTTDHARVGDELGGEEALVAFHQALRQHGMGNVVDVVPNHMSVADASANQRWWSVLRDGPGSEAARFFDIDWMPPEPKLSGKILLPVLGNDYASEVADGNIEIVQVDGAWEVHYGDLRFPVAVGTVARTLSEPSEVHAALDQQHYRLACWRVGRDEINYRRFFDVTTLAGVRVEDPDVFAAVHERTLQWVRSGDVQGLRIDHPDGLRDPTGYLEDLRSAAPDAWIVVEKILEPGEELPDSWPVDGTTGYDMMRKLSALFVDPAGERTLTTIFNSFVSDWRDYGEQLVESKQLAIEQLFGAEVTRLVGLAAHLCEAGIVARDFSRAEIRRAIVALLVATPVYRTYVRDGGGPVSEQDEAVVVNALDAASTLEPLIDEVLFEFIGQLLRGQAMSALLPRSAVDDFAARFQQLSGPAMAKGLEDTLFYRYNRLIALNEVGSDPAQFGMTIGEFHDDMNASASTRPLSMSSTGTHDTKRSEDVRSRIALLSEIADEWGETFLRWMTMNSPKWAAGSTDPSMEYMLYQTLIGSYPLAPERAREFLTKAVREAKRLSTWLYPTDFENDLFAFADAIAADDAFQTDLARFVSGLDDAARLASLSQLILKAMVPGVPDFYQGSELTTTSLVDPDNRNDVDYLERVRLLDELDLEGGRPVDVHVFKLWMTRRLLQIRRAVPDAFSGPDADYRPIAIDGQAAERAIAFCRGGRVVVIAPVRPVAISRIGWGDTSITLPPSSWSDALDSSASVEGGRTLEGRVRVDDLVHGDCAILIKGSGSIEGSEQA